MSRTTIIVPCYNEANRLDPARFERFLRSTPGVNLLFVDDGSSDNTGDILQRLCSLMNGRCAVRSLPANAGKAEAVRQGILQALEEPQEYVGFWDADLATPLEAIPAFVSVFEERPELVLVMGARVRLLGRQIERLQARHYLGRVFATAVSIMLGIPVYDTQCGAKLFRASEDVRLLFGRPFRSKWIFDVEVLARLVSARRYTRMPQTESIVYELPLLEWRDVAGSKLHGGDFLRAIADAAAIYWSVLLPKRDGSEWRPMERPRSNGVSLGSGNDSASGVRTQIRSTNHSEGE